jgi:hypothetical protein
MAHARRYRGAFDRTVHGVHAVRLFRRRCAAELERVERVRQKIGNRVRFRGTTAVRRAAGGKRIGCS